MHFALRCISSHKAGAGRSDKKRKMIIGGVVAAAFAAVVGVAFVCMGANNVGGGIPKPPMHVHDEDEASTGIHSGSLNESGSETVRAWMMRGRPKARMGRKHASRPKFPRLNLFQRVKAVRRTTLSTSVRSIPVRRIPPAKALLPPTTTKSRLIPRTIQVATLRAASSGPATTRGRG